MKKQIIAAGLAVCMAGTLLGCGGSAKKDGEITLGTYEGLKVGQSVYDSVTQDKVDEQAMAALKEYGTYIDKGSAAENGDQINIDFTGYLEGEDKPFDNGSATGKEFILGEENFIEGFQEALVGHSAGEEFDIHVTFPEDYGQASLKGQKARFAIKMNSVKILNLPELNDDFVKQYFGKSYPVETVDEFYAYIKQQLTYYAVENAVMEDLLKSCEVKTWPEGKVDELFDDTYAQYETAIPQMYGVDLKTYYTAIGFTEESFKKLIRSAAEEEIKTQMMIKAIAKKQKISFTDDEYKMVLNQLKDSYKLESVEKVEEKIGKEEVEFSVLYQKVMEWICDHAVAYDDSAEKETTTKAEDETTTKAEKE